MRAAAAAFQAAMQQTMSDFQQAIRKLELAEQAEELEQQSVRQQLEQAEQRCKEAGHAAEAHAANVAVLKAEHETSLAAAQHASSISEARADAPDISPMRPGEAVTEEGDAGEEEGEAGMADEESGAPLYTRPGCKATRTPMLQRHAPTGRQPPCVHPACSPMRPGCGDNSTAVVGPAAAAAAAVASGATAPTVAN